jgi:DNA-binding transcriptional LysR family regulator
VEALRRLNRLHPRLQVTLAEEGPVAALPRLARGDLDLVLAKDWSNSPLVFQEGLTRAALLDDVADVALHADHPLARRRTITLGELAGERWITSEHGSFCHDWLRHTLRTRGRDPVVTHTAGEYSTQLAMVAAGFGAAIIPRLGRETVPPEVHMVPITPTLVRHIYAVWRTDATRRTAIQAAVEALQFVARRLGGARATGRPGARRSRSTASPRSSSSARRDVRRTRSTPSGPSSA